MGIGRGARGGKGREGDARGWWRGNTTLLEFNMSICK